MSKDLAKLEQLIFKAMKKIPNQAVKIIKAEGLNHIERNFKQQRFLNGQVEQKWQKRNAQGKYSEVYKTNRVGRKGTLNRYGRKNEGRAILVGHNTAGNKLRNSFRTKINRRKQVVFYTYKPYAKRHNEGLDGMPKRQFMGYSKYLDTKIKNKLNKELDKHFK